MLGVNETGTLELSQRSGSSEEATEANWKNEVAQIRRSIVEEPETAREDVPIVSPRGSS